MTQRVPFAEEQIQLVIRNSIVENIRTGLQDDQPSAVQIRTLEFVQVLLSSELAHQTGDTLLTSFSDKKDVFAECEATILSLIVGMALFSPPGEVQHQAEQAFQNSVSSSEC